LGVFRCFEMSPPKTPSFDQGPATQSTVVSHQKNGVKHVQH